VTEAVKYVVVTGAAGGIGQALVHAFHDVGYRVVATDRVPAPAGLPCSLWIEADLARTVHDEAFAADVFHRIGAHVGAGTLRVLVNNAALQVLGGIADLTRDDWRRTLDVNLLAPFIWTQALLPALEAARGCVVNVSSIHARLTKRDFVAYATSKAALSGMTRALAVDMGHRVRVNAIEPAAIETPMLAAGFEGKPELYARLEAAHPAARIGRPDEVAALAVALCDGRMAFVSGACVALDGGVGARLHDPD
jgi:NAD(P)-dependent dehydrogenase (short-subunit alcohol dehydrogenase family)